MSDNYKMVQAEADGVSVRHVAEQTHLFTKELYEKLTDRRAKEFPTAPTTLMLLEHTNTMLTSILDKV